MVKSLSQEFFSEEEKRTVSDAVHSAEIRTSGEIVPMVVSQSHSYPLAEIRGGCLVALPAALLLTSPVAGTIWLEPTNMWIFLGLFLPICWGTMLLIRFFPSLKRLMLFNEEMEAEVQETAFASFFTERLHKTRDANGILIFISLLERRAWIIADSGISSRIPQERWQDAIVHVTRGIREKNQCQALCRAIEMIGAILEKEFPIRKDDRNELHNLIIR
jgi:putative membrane protein